MTALFLLLTVSLLVAAGFLFAYLRASRSGQFDDLQTPAMRMLGDDGQTIRRSEEKKTK